MDAKAARIKTGVVTRTIKELQSYRKELVAQSKRVQDLKDYGADEHDVRQQDRVLMETVQMLPDVRRRLESACTDLQTFMSDYSSQLAGTPELVEAKRAVDDAEMQLAIADSAIP